MHDSQVLWSVSGSSVVVSRQTMEIVEDFAYDAKNLKNLRRLRFFDFSPFFFIFQSSDHTPKPAKNRRTVPVVNMTISFCENSILASQFIVNPRFHVFHFFTIAFFFLKKMFLLLLFSCNFSKMCFSAGTSVKVELLMFPSQSVLRADVVSWRHRAGQLGLGWATYLGESMIQLPEWGGGSSPV